MGGGTVQAKQWLYKCYSDSALSEAMVKRLYADFKHNHTDTDDAERSRSPRFDSCPRKHQKTPQTHFG